jgi:hypothetical protein
MTISALISTTISQARLRLAKELNLEPGELRLCGNMYGPDYRLILFTVEKPGSALNRTTRSVKVNCEP